MAHDVFISYSAKDKNIANAVCTRLESEKIRCWIAPRDITAGRKWAEAISEAIPESKILVLIFSSYANSSDQVLREVELAFDSKLAVIPFRVEDAEASGGMKYYLATTHWIDALNPPLEKQLNYLVKSAKTILAIKDIDDTGGGEPWPQGPIQEGQGNGITKFLNSKWKLIVSISAIIVAVAVILFMIKLDTNTPQISKNSAEGVKQQSTASAAIDKNNVNFTDKKFEALIREIIKKPEGSIAVSDVERIDSIYANGRDISSIDGIEYLKNLKMLDLSDNSISGIKPLSGMKNLNNLKLANNNIVDIDPLQKLFNLQGVSLNGNQVRDIRALENLSKLKALSLYSNLVSDVGPLSKLDSLEDLDLANNKISDISPLSGLKALKRLAVRENPIRDYSPLDNLKDTQILK